MPCVCVCVTTTLLCAVSQFDQRAHPKTLRPRERPCMDKWHYMSQFGDRSLMTINLVGLFFTWTIFFYYIINFRASGYVSMSVSSVLLVCHIRHAYVYLRAMTMMMHWRIPAHGIRRKLFTVLGWRMAWFIQIGVCSAFSIRVSLTTIKVSTHPNGNRVIPWERLTQDV